MLANIASMFYDGRVRKIFLFIFFLVLFSLPSTPPSFAQVCEPGSFKTECTEQCAGCPSGTGELKVEQCNADGTGYDPSYGECSTECAGFCTSDTPTPTTQPTQSPTSTPTPSPVLTPPACSTADRRCYPYTPEDCQPLNESGCSNYHCLPLSDGTGRSTCRYDPRSPTPIPPTPTLTPTPPPFPPPCLEGKDKDGNTITIDQNADQRTRQEQGLKIVKCTKVDSAVGGLDTEPAAFITKIYLIILSMAGGWAVYLIIVGGYKLMFSQGNPEAVQEAREKITSAIVGLLFIIFSLVILQIIGADILNIPSFK